LNLKVAFMFLVYFTIVSLIFIIGSPAGIFDDYSANISLNESELTPGEVEQAGFFSIGISFGRFFGWVLFGVGLPSDTPGWFTVLFFAWETIISILAVVFVVSSIWDG